MSELSDKALVRHYNEATRTLATHMFVSEKKSVSDIARKLEIPVSTVWKWFQHLPKSAPQKRDIPLPNRSQEEWLNKYFATKEPKFLRAALTAKPLLAGKDVQSEDDE